MDFESGVVPEVQMEQSVVERWRVGGGWQVPSGP